MVASFTGTLTVPAEIGLALVHPVIREVGGTGRQIDHQMLDIAATRLRLAQPTIPDLHKGNVSESRRRSCTAVADHSTTRRGRESVGGRQSCNGNGRTVVL